MSVVTSCSYFSLHCCFTLQVQLLYELLLSWSSTWARLQRHGILRQTSTIPEPPAGAAPSSPVRSSAGTALPDTSTCSPSADFGSPTEVCFSSHCYIGQIVSLVFLLPFMNCENHLFVKVALFHTDKHSLMIKQVPKPKVFMMKLQRVTFLEEVKKKKNESLTMLKELKERAFYLYSIIQHSFFSLHL